MTVPSELDSNRWVSSLLCVKIGISCSVIIAHEKNGRAHIAWGSIRGPAHSGSLPIEWQRTVAITQFLSNFGDTMCSRRGIGYSPLHLSFAGMNDWLCACGASSIVQPNDRQCSIHVATHSPCVWSYLCLFSSASAKSLFIKANMQMLRPCWHEQTQLQVLLSEAGTFGIADPWEHKCTALAVDPFRESHINVDLCREACSADLGVSIIDLSVRYMTYFFQFPHCFVEFHIAVHPLGLSWSPQIQVHGYLILWNWTMILIKTA